MLSRCQSVQGITVLLCPACDGADRFAQFMISRNHTAQQLQLVRGSLRQPQSAVQKLRAFKDADFLRVGSFYLPLKSSAIGDLLVNTEFGSTILIMLGKCFGVYKFIL